MLECAGTALPWHGSLKRTRTLPVNLRAGELPPPEGNGIRYLRLPLNQIGNDDA